MSTPEKTHEQRKPADAGSGQSRPQQVSVRPAESSEPDRHKLHWFSACPCHSGLRFGKCCGSDGSETCRYEST
ncbi:MAG: hypothetical protein ACOCVI_02835 [Planctomycetota bacterium]